MSKARDLANAGTALGAVTATELAYVDGVTSAIQTQIDSKIGSASAINPTIVDAKGDIIAATAADTVARLAVGANGTVLTAASGQATGLEWATPSSGSMTLLSTTSLSGASVTISSINQTYQDLFLIISGITNATADGLNRIAPNGTTDISSLSGSFGLHEGYRLNYLLLSGTGAKFLRTNADNCFALSIYNYSSTSTIKPVSIIGNFYENYNIAGRVGSNFAGGINTASAISSLVFSNDGGNLSTGTVKIYGVK